MENKDLTRSCMILVSALMKKYNYALHLDEKEDRERIDEIIDYAVRKTLEIDKRLNIGLEEEITENSRQK